MNEENSSAVEILIVEDSPTQAEKLKFILERSNHRLAVARNGKQALELVRERKPSIVITDVVMPEMDGYQLCRAIRADAGLKNVAVILLTSLSNAEDVLKGLECGADNFITKPYDEANLLDRVAHVLSNLDLRDTQVDEPTLEINFAGNKHFIKAGRQQILNLLLSTYDTAVQRNDALVKAKNELRKTNLKLEEKTTQLEGANKELEAFSFSVSHDLRAPLRTIRSFAHILAEDCSSSMNNEARNYLERISAAVERMNQLIEGLLKLFGVTTGRLERQAVDLGEIAASVIEELRRSQPDRKVDVKIAPQICVQGDKALLRVVMENLLNNAWKFTGKKSHASIEVGVEHRAEKPVCFVRDNGAGFDMQMAEKLFAPFQRLHSNADFAGSGIGLATVQRIIHRHGGKIWAEAEPGRGATFYFVLE